MHGSESQQSKRLFSAPAKKSRRPAGVSRRKKKQLGFEQLEVRQVMSAESPVGDLQSAIAGALQLQTSNLSSDTSEGATLILLNEMQWQALIAANASANASVASTNSIPTDPLLGQQWHLVNTGQRVSNPDVQPIYGIAGQDINVAPVWSEGIFGNGVVVAVIDSGVQTSHPDLAANIDLTRQFDPLEGDTNANPNLANPANAHGTAVAGLIGAIANNGIGGTGVAPGVTLVPIRLIDAGQTNQAFVDAFRYTINNGIDITNNSWGPTAVRGLAGPTAEQLLAIRDSIVFGRDGKGVIHVFSSGNDAGPAFNEGFTSIGGFSSAGYNGWINTRYTIAVTGVDHDGFYGNADGTVTAYPEAGANIFVAAPTGSNAGDVITNELGVGSGLTTTDTLGNTGFNAGPDANGQETLDPFLPLDRDFLANPDYTSRFNGTSASAPLVSGVVALMLDANPDLTWRDVQEILVRSARQNAQFDVPTDQFTPGSATQNTWIINQMPIFQAPDPWDPTINPSLQTLNPTLNPNVTTQGAFDHSVPVALLPTFGAGMTNGAGYTISQGTGIYGEQIGYGHGTIDAQMAVALAKQWSTKGQSLPAEFTFSTFVSQVGGSTIPIPAVEKGSQESGFQLVPGKPGGRPGFIAFWNEYFADQPDFSQNFQPQGQDLFLDVAPPNTMSVETVEVKLSIRGGTEAALSNLRVMLVSPNGTQSELNNFWVSNPVPFTLQNDSARNRVVGDPGSLDTSPGQNLVWTFTSNRTWGERSDDAVVYDAVTGDPVVDQSGLSSLTGNPSVSQALKQGWRLVLENYSATPLNLDGAEVVWHGSKISSETKRISGFVGVDQVRDDAFNFSRMTQTQVGDVDGDPNTLRYGEVVNDIDLNQEPFAGNVTVTLRRTSDNAVVKQFVTGHDGNYYFDVVPGDYIVSVEDPLGRTALDDTTQTPAGHVKKYLNQWHVTPEWFNAWDRFDVAGKQEVPVNASGVPLAWTDSTGAVQPDHVRNINFLLTPPAPEANFGGVVYADLDGNGAFGAGDSPMPNVTVYADADNDGVFDAGELSDVSDAAGQYSFTLPLASAAIVNVRVVAPSGWTVTEPTGGVQSVFAQLGQTFPDVDFGLKPPLGGGGSGSGNGFILGTVFEDLNGDGARQLNEGGLAGFQVYVDLNANGVFNAGEPEATTNSSGGYLFSNITPGSKQVRVQITSPYTQTSPTNGGPRTVTVTAGGTISGVVFGVRNGATFDYGDLPAIYNATTLAQNGARHRKTVYILGALLDAELNGAPSVDADGDDLTAVPDEDGIQFGSLTAGSTGSLVATAVRNNGYLQGWVDWNNDGDFNDAGERIITNKLLDAGANAISFEVPVGAVAQPYARFRYGEFGINSIFGEALVGEVEDYRLTVAPAPGSPLIAGMPADFDQDGDVDGADFMIWQRGFGVTVVATQHLGSADADGDVDRGDLSLWRQSFGTTAAPALTAQSSDFNGDGGVDGADLLSWQRNLGALAGATLAMGDGNGDHAVGGADLAVWRGSYGVSAASASSSGAVDSTSSLTLDAATPAVGGEYFVSAVTVASRPADESVESQSFDRGLRRAMRPALRTILDDSRVFDAEAAGVRFFDRRDRAFDDFAPGEKKKASRHETTADESADDESCDEAFAMLAEFGRWPK